MKILRLSLLVLATAAGGIALSPDASAQAGGPQIHRMEDGQKVDFGQNLGQDLKATIRNVGRCPIRVRWFDKQAAGGKWKEKVLHPGQSWSRVIEWGEALEVHDLPDHHDSVFGAMFRPLR